MLNVSILLGDSDTFEQIHDLLVELHRAQCLNSIDVYGKVPVKSEEIDVFANCRYHLIDNTQTIVQLYNAALRNTIYEMMSYHLFLSPRCVVTADVLDSLYLMMEKNHGIGVIVPPVMPDSDVSFLFVRMAAVQKVHLFDERYGAYYYVRDLLRALDKEWGTFSLPESIIQFDGNVSQNKHRLCRRTIDACKYYFKWYLTPRG